LYCYCSSTEGKQYKCNYFSVIAILARQSKSFLYTVLDLMGRAFKENSIRATTSLSSPVEEFSLPFFT
ncbi:hypothetical protein, partial [Peribacillus frigoritolerans]|uniref:hypothetical protein n=1 Tax=Peribacillus frigoritolerans TaxID=450367 RepID=UPI00227DD7F4